MDQYYISSLDNIQTQELVSNYSENAIEYLKNITNEVKLSTNFKYFSNTLSTKFSSSVSQTNMFNGKYLYGSIELLVKKRNYKILNYYNSDNLKNYVTQRFIDDVNSLSPEMIIDLYGTHVILEVTRGGKLEATIQAETTELTRTEIIKYETEAGVKDVFNIGSGSTSGLTYKNKAFNRNMNYNTRGGNSSQGILQGTIDLSLPISQINIQSWQNSIDNTNSVLISFAEITDDRSFIIIYDLVSDPIKKQLLKNYVDQYLIDRSAELDHIPVDIHRYTYKNFETNFYTRNFVNSLKDYKYKGIAFKAFDYKVPGTVPIYRFSRKLIGLNTYLYTQVPFAPSGYTAEGIEFYAFPISQSGYQPIHRLARGGIDNYYLKGNLTIPSGYTYIGVEFYAL